MATDLQKKWEDRINRAKAIRDEWKDQFKVDMGIAYFEGKQNPGYPEEEWLTLNKIYSHLQAQLPSLYSVDPYFYVKLKKSYKPDVQTIEEYRRRGHIRQGILNYLKGELELKPKARMAVQMAHFAFGVLKERHNSTLEDNPDKGQPLKDEEGNDLKDENGEVMINPDQIPIDEKFETCWVHFNDFLWDEDAGPLEDSWAWVAENIKMTRSQALKDKRFKRADVKNIKAVEPDKAKKNILSKWLDLSSPQKKPDDLLSFWEIYDLREKKWLIIAENADKVMMEPDDLPPGVEKHPYCLLRFTLRDKSPYPIPPVYPALDAQKEYNLARSRMMTHRKRFNRKYTVIAGMLENEAEIDKLEAGDDGTIIRAMAHGAVEPIKDAPLDQQNYMETSFLNNDIVEAFGTPDAARGLTGADSATEAGIIEKRLDIREGDRLSLVVDFITTWAKKLDQLVIANLTKEMAVNITGPQGESWVKVDPEADLEDINGEFEYSVNVGASQPLLPDVERAQWLAFISQAIIPMPHILTAPNFMKRMAEMYHIEDEAALEELRVLGMKMLSGAMPMPGNGGGSQPAENNPAASAMGSALGVLGGNANGGGSQV